MTLVEFLLARIAEDERTARDAPGPHWVRAAEREGTPGRWSGIRAELVSLPPERDVLHRLGPDVLRAESGDLRADCMAADHAARHDPARVLAECDAKRQIVEIHWDNNGGCDRCADGAWAADGWSGVEREAWPCETLRLLALPYADHPDYDPAWAITT